MFGDQIAPKFLKRGEKQVLHLSTNLGHQFLAGPYIAGCGNRIETNRKE